MRILPAGTSTSSPMAAQSKRSSGWRVIYHLAVISVRRLRCSSPSSPYPLSASFLFPSSPRPRDGPLSLLFPLGFIHFRSSHRWRLKVDFSSLTAKLFLTSLHPPPPHPSVSPGRSCLSHLVLDPFHHRWFSFCSYFRFSIRSLWMHEPAVFAEHIDSP